MVDTLSNTLEAYHESDYVCVCVCASCDFSFCAHSSSKMYSKSPASGQQVAIAPEL